MLAGLKGFQEPSRVGEVGLDSFPTQLAYYVLTVARAVPSARESRTREAAMSRILFMAEMIEY
ncbi:MAG: hypothetical protein RQ824_05335 [bacterium]|nr:hypothetical protein [bacterium]